jgi:DNA polymerase-4
MRHSSDALLRKAFGGIVGNYWYNRLHFIESDLYQNQYRAMSAGRTVSREQRESKQTLESLLIALLTRLEQRMVKQKIFCKALSFSIRYKDGTSWDTLIKFTDFTQDSIEMRSYVTQYIHDFEHSHRTTVLNNKTQHIVVVVSNFITDKFMQYGLFDNRIQKDKARNVMYNIKDRYGRDIVRRASETVTPNVMRDAIGFGSVKDLYQLSDSDSDNELGPVNQYLLEE